MQIFFDTSMEISFVIAVALKCSLEGWERVQFTSCNAISILSLDEADGVV